VCAALSDTDSYTGKTAHVRDFFTKGTDGSEYRNPLRLYCIVSVIAVQIFVQISTQRPAVLSQSHFTTDGLPPISLS
jgi:hypothetical protein